MAIHDENVTSFDDRTRRQVEAYRKGGNRNGARSVLGVLSALPTFRAPDPVEAPETPRLAKAKPRPTTRLAEVQAVVDAIEFKGEHFAVRQIEEGFLISVADRQWFVPPHASEEDIVETVFLACQRMLHDNFRFRGERVFPHRKERSAPDVTLPPVLTTPRRAVLVIKPAKGEVEQSVKVLQTYFQMSRTQARNVVWRRRKIKADALQVTELNDFLTRSHLQTRVHLAGCPRA